jgi:hypothetical protein
MAGNLAAGTGQQNLTGIWNGLYTYSTGRSVSFVATLIDSGGSFTGTTHEADSFGSASLCASLAGTYSEGAVSFTKTYDKPGILYRSPISYRGALNSDGTEIEGRWTIHRWRSGKFLMVRPAPRAETVSQQVEEKV